MTANSAYCSWTVDEPPYTKCPFGSRDDQWGLWAWLAPSQRRWPKTTTHQWIISQFTNCSLDWVSNTALAQTLQLLCKASNNAWCIYDIWQQIAITMDLPTAADYDRKLESAKRWHWYDSHIIKRSVYCRVQSFEQYYICGHSRRKPGLLIQMHAKWMEDAPPQCEMAHYVIYTKLLLDSVFHVCICLWKIHLYWV
jgi:hypothetical protein